MVTERRRAEDELRARERLHAFQSAILAAVRDPVWATDASLAIVYWNDAATATFGWTADEVMGRNTGDLFQTGVQGSTRDATVAGMLRTGEFFGEIVCRCKDGRSLLVEASSRVVRGPDGEVVQVVSTARDVTERKRSDEARKKAEDSLRAANEALRQADRRKSEFLAVLSHELRNPLAPIRNGAFVLEHAPPGSEPARRAREIIHRQADHLTRLVDDLLDLTRITHGKIELHKGRLDARELTAKACEDARAGFEHRGVRLRFSAAAEPVWVDADAARLTQMVGNVLANALKFTPTGGAVEVVTEPRGERCEITVRDTGVGIAREDLERIFGAFEQGVAASRVHGGLGIGLALAKDLIERHGGSIEAHSDGPGKGATFVLSLPLAPPPAPHEVGVDPDAPSPPLSILIVEDNLDAATTLADLLALAGHQVEVVHSGREGVERARGGPDVLISDLGLPDLHGNEVVRAVRALPGGSRIFTIALTGYAQPDDRASARAAGFDAHLPKPAPMDALHQLLANVARGRRAARPSSA